MSTKKIFRKLTDNKGETPVKLAPQEEVVFGCIPKSKTGIERADLVAKLTTLSEGDEPKLKTRQSPSSILGYYTKHLIDSGLIEVETIKEEVKKEVKEAKAA